MNFEDYLEMGAVQTIEDPNIPNLDYDPYWDEEASVEEHLDHEAYLEGMISHWLGLEVRL